MYKTSQILFLLIFVSNCISAQGDVKFVPILSDFVSPVSIANAGDGSNNLYIVEKEGFIQTIHLSGGISKSSKPFLDISDRVDDSKTEQGLLGLAFHPDYITNGYLYVYYTFDPGPGLDISRISRFTYDVGSQADTIDPDTELVILPFAQTSSNHNAGDMHFGSDGYLYIASGDGGGAGDPFNNAQNTTNLLGKILRIDVDTPSGSTNYSIPSGNPFGNEIWLYGLRNPWRFSFDSETDEMYIADVGQIEKEEINVIPANTGGLNLGWNCREGFDPYAGCTGVFHEPIFDIPHDNTGGESVTGGFVYRGNTFDDFKGWYFFIDYETNRFWQTKGTTSAGLQVVTELMTDVNGISAFGLSESQELYAVSYQDDILYRIIDMNVCADIVNISSALTDSTYSANSLLSSDALLPSNSNIVFSAQEVSLVEGFSVPTPAEFEVINQICGKN